MRLREQLLTKNECYTGGRTIRPKGVMVHSTGANNPNVSRYVPGDAEMGRNTGGNHWDQPGKLCVHAFIGKFADGRVGTVQTLPWNRRGWHCGKGEKGSANDTHISFEICEDGLKNRAYFQAAYQEAVELTAMLCREYGLDPLKDGVVICHAEGYKRGVASNHGDVLHWWPRFGKNMDDFRSDVARTLRGEADKMSYEQWKEYMERYRRELWTLPGVASGTMAEEMQRAVAAGITDGSGPQALPTRQEVVSMIVRAGK
ncbi:MAG: N-acetylmuramoyl-L-alanine amidase [Lawsonibacter sp.]|nr:N-acetylmuramoyl-L-alanine amidase [Lawsonibacter sp.]